ncbi:IDEAL domain-containing protein [Exiguobacterium sp. RIT452]|uniref:IDEAL domain protein n=1 Tax=Exiguobacterium undae TaxID=169177 RepID=A0ABX2VB38_9BACL|nr:MULTISPECIES: ReoY family proteolytic degradation factor [Exiguobacterium]OAN15163.1 IDEAL domain protein [Exiguobacterium undae]RJP00347.1 IDEAL domain-containing protein [Exiguobacterium sp. RIT452]
MTERKQRFLRRILTYYTLKRRESKWIIDYWLRNESKLDRVHFVQNAMFAPKAMIITTYGFDADPFLFKKGEVKTTDPEKAYHDIRLTDEDVYIELNFQGMMMDDEYLSLLEENPFRPEVAVEPKLVDEAMNFIAATVNRQEEERLIRLIDEALDARDKNRFQSLSDELRLIRSQL